MTLLSNAAEESSEKAAAVVSFTVLNADATFGNYGKPNAIVRPVRRMGSTDEPSQHQHQQQLQESQRPTAPDNDAGDDSEMTAALVDTTESMANKDMDNFAQQLDLKLRGLQHSKKTSSKNVNDIGAFVFCIVFISCSSKKSCRNSK